jgi:hypothetical protein
MIFPKSVYTSSSALRLEPVTIIIIRNAIIIIVLISSSSRHLCVIILKIALIHQCQCQCQCQCLLALFSCLGQPLTTMGQHTSQRNAFEPSFELAYVIAMNKDNKNNCGNNYFSAPYCNRCKDRLSEIFQVNGDYCLECWQELTCPEVKSK